MAEYKYSGVVRSQTLTLYPTRDKDGDNISCEGSNLVYSIVVRDSIALDLIYPPIIYAVAPQTVVEGNYSLLECSASSKPPSTYRWYKEGQQHALFQGNGSPDHNRLVYNMSSVSRADAGTYRCEADNGVETPDSKTFVLTVLYPPDVIVDGSNTTVLSNSTQLTCMASGVPDTYYMYGEWLQEWPSYGVVFKGPGGPTLTISSLTYEHSGIYRCSASNGIKVFGTSQEYMEGSLNLLVKSFPVKAYSDTNTNDVLVVPGKLNSVTVLAAEYYSASELSVKCFKVQHGDRQTEAVCQTSVQEAAVRLKVFSHIVSAPGWRIYMSVNIDSEDDLGMYYVEVSNDIGLSVLKLEIVCQGPPKVPQAIQFNSISHTSVTVTWQPGFHGGYDQTVIVQLSSDRISWVNETAMDVGRNRLRTSTTLEYLDSSKTYFLRMFAYNVQGRSSLTEILNFTTTSQEKESRVVSEGKIAGGIATSFIAGALVAAAVVLFIVIRKRGYVCKGKKEPKVPDESSSPQYDCLQMHEQTKAEGTYSSLTPDNKQKVPNESSSPQYEPLQMQAEPTVTATYSSLSPDQKMDESQYYNMDAEGAYVNIHAKES